ncbi:BREX-2 system phosphatase PglZ [Nocardia farcinica]|uniref:BREX-2 system phosphatase PglZ n=1 Tax=Nocardia farcinica TaxID=37329 RepID=UPI001894F790|nr:BREX-2 system phosphatase PglZ [Nocardia farcinica]MBF6231833.1 BREX-2 system phosphatase PglZ [Nocardia farcinica]
MSAPSMTTALRLSRATVAQYLSSRKRLDEVLATPGDPVILLLRGEPEWEGDPVLALADGRRARVVVGASPLAVHEIVLAHAREIDPDPRVLLVLTSVEEHDLDPAILVRTDRGRVHTVDRWDIVRESFDANALDPWLKRESWACEALLDAAGAQGWPAEVTGGVLLSRGPALTALAARRLGIEVAVDRIDPLSLLEWSQRPGAPQLLLDLRAPEREGLAKFLSETEQCGATGAIVTALVWTGHGAEAVAYGLVCAALWRHATADNTVYQARGRVERWLGDNPPAVGPELDRLLETFSRTCEDYVRDLLVKARTSTDPHDEADEAARHARKLVDTVLGQADLLVRQFGAGAAAEHSPLLRAGLEARFTAAGKALARGDIEKIDNAVTALRAHDLAADHRVRVGRVRMAQRLTRWLHTEPDPTSLDSVAAALDRQMRDTAWADRALDYLDAGGDDNADLRIAYEALATRARTLRREFDREFAKNLAAWTEAGTPPGAMLTVETFLHRVVRPLTRDHRVLLVVVDGMSAAIATELAGELRGTFAEYDPLPGNGTPYRRCMAAALPSLTAVSRTSLFAATLMKGDQKTEQRLFPQHGFWNGREAKVFHKSDLRSRPGERFGADLSTALADQNCHVAVVLNTIDDRLAKEVKLDDSGWEAREIGDLRALLSVATSNGMVVLVTSDHGHVVDRHSVPVEATNIESARHRLPAGEHDRRAENEIPLHGPRVVWPEPGASIVALWDTDSRYTTQKAGYHGGASLAEMTIPVLAFLPFEAERPADWRELGDQRPAWWRDNTDALPQPRASYDGPKANTGAGKKAAVATSDQITLDIPLPSEPLPRQATSVVDDLITELLASEVFEAQLLVPQRKPPVQKVEKAIRALLEGPQSTTAIAQRVGFPPTRAAGFAAVLRQVLNVDGAQVLETLPDGRTLRLHVGLLRTQFELR